MSLENHPNIHAVGLTMDIIQSIDNRLRGDGDDYREIIMRNKGIRNKITDFVVDVSTIIDEIVEESHKESNKKVKEAFEK